MHQFYTTIFLLFCLLNVFLPGAGAVSFEDEQFLLFYGNDVRGETEPCG